MIRIEGIYKKFRKLQVLENVSAQFNTGEVISLIGPNGSGKTTLIKSILGMVRPDKGKIFVLDELINILPNYRNHIGYMPQIGRYPDNMKIGQLFDMIENVRNIPKQKQDRTLIGEFGLDKMFEKPMRTLSGGTRQKVSAALAFLFDPQILILDEPTAGLDPLSSELLKQKIIAEKNKKKLIIITSHVLSDLDELTTRVMYMQEGRVQFLENIETLREQTGEIRLEKAIARIMKGENLNATWIDKQNELIKEKKQFNRP